MRVQIVSFRCVLKNNLGQLISSSFNQEVATSPQSEESTVLPGFIEGLKGLKKGQRKKIFVSAGDAYGFYDQNLVVEMPRAKFVAGKDLKVGHQITANFRREEEPRLYRVIGASKGKVILDGNHPLAGQDLVFDVEVTSSRDEVENEFDEVIQSKMGLLH